jgi:SPP1 gp7 family putative phage head morphogenesis protein
MSKDDFEKELDKIIRQIWKDNGFTGELNAALVKYYADKFWQATTQGYGSDLGSFDFNTPDYLFLERLQKDVWLFSSAKNYQQMQAISDALVDPNGKVRSFADFKIEASQVNSDFVGAWLQSEYNFAIAGGQMASKWQTIEKNKIDLPLLQYVTVGDDRVRPAHRELEGIVRPVDDAFWNVYFPPNGWNCRCTVKQLQQGDAEVTPWEKIFLPDSIPAIFKTNLGKQGVVFPPGSPYYEGMPPSIAITAEELRKRFYGK